MNVKVLRFILGKNGFLEAHVTAVPGWSGFDKIACFLQVKRLAKVVKRVEGPDARRWIFTVEGSTIELRHDDVFGNSVLATDKEGEALVRELATDLVQRLDEI